MTRLHSRTRAATILKELATKKWGGNGPWNWRGSTVPETTNTTLTRPSTTNRKAAVRGGCAVSHGAPPSPTLRL